MSAGERKPIKTNFTNLSKRQRAEKTESELASLRTECQGLRQALSVAKQLRDVYAGCYGPEGLPSSIKRFDEAEAALREGKKES